MPEPLGLSNGYSGETTTSTAQQKEIHHQSMSSYHQTVAGQPGQTYQPMEVQPGYQVVGVKTIY